MVETRAKRRRGSRRHATTEDRASPATQLNPDQDQEPPNKRRTRSFSRRHGIQPGPESDKRQPPDRPEPGRKTPDQPEAGRKTPERETPRAPPSLPPTPKVLRLGRNNAESSAARAQVRTLRQTATEALAKRGLQLNDRAPTTSRFVGPGRILGTGAAVPSTRPPTRPGTNTATPSEAIAGITLSASAWEPSRTADGWKPSIVIGRSLGDNLSAIELADRKVQQWEAIYEHTMRETPDAIGPIEEQLAIAREEREGMEENEETTTPHNQLESTRRAAIDDRTKMLREAMESSECPAEVANIFGAIKAYQDGLIEYWNKWTLIWNGRVVDYCPSYASFTEDRPARLDRYAEQFGPGWLWYEAPLEQTGSEPPRAMKATWTVANNNAYDMGSFNITMGFRRMKAFVNRDWERHARKAGRKFKRAKKAAARMKRATAAVSPPTTASSSSSSSSSEDADEDAKGGRRQARTKANMMVQEDPQAPEVFFDVLLDSGATFPALHQKDFHALGIRRKNYPAQSACRMVGVNNQFLGRIYECRAWVCTSDCQSLADARCSVYPNQPHAASDVVPVLMLTSNNQGNGGGAYPSGDSSSPISVPRSKPRSTDDAPTRLSGQVPFRTCYISLAPGTRTIWFGEDRKDVLGAQKFPGQRRMELGKAAEQAVNELRRMASATAPSIRFEHELPGGKYLVDEEEAAQSGVSAIRIVDAKGGKEVEYRIDPKQELPQKRKKKAERKMATKGLRKKSQVLSELGVEVEAGA